MDQARASQIIEQLAQLRTQAATTKTPVIEINCHRTIQILLNELKQIDYEKYCQQRTGD